MMDSVVTDVLTGVVDMIDTKPYLDRIDRLLIGALESHACESSYRALERLKGSRSVVEAFPEIASLGVKKLVSDSYACARNARYKKRMNIVDEMRLEMYEIPNELFEDEKVLTGKGGVDGRASGVVRSAAQVATVVAGKAMFEWLKLDACQRDFWRSEIAKMAV